MKNLVPQQGYTCNTTIEEVIGHQETLHCECTEQYAQYNIDSVLYYIRQIQFLAHVLMSQLGFNHFQVFVFFLFPEFDGCRCEIMVRFQKADL